MQHPVSTRQDVFENSLVDNCRTARIGYDVQLAQNALTIQGHVKDAAVFSTTSRGPSSEAGFSEVQVKLVDPAFERYVIAETTGAGTVKQRRIRRAGQEPAWSLRVISSLEIAVWAPSVAKLIRVRFALAAEDAHRFVRKRCHRRDGDVLIRYGARNNGLGSDDARTGHGP